MNLDEKKLASIFGGFGRAKEKDMTQMYMTMMESEECFEDLKEKLEEYKRSGRTRKQAAAKLIIDFKNMDHNTDLKTAKMFVDKYWDEL